MYNFSTATLEGFVAQEPRVKKTKTGKSVCSFTLAVNHYSKSENESKVSFIDVETWEKLADICGANISKGKWIFVMGTLKQDRWEDDKGKVQSRVKIIGNEVRMLESFKSSAHSTKEFSVV